jgi:hypothetical protein
MKLWPRDKQDLATFGVNDVSYAVDYFCPLLVENNVYINAVMNE